MILPLQDTAALQSVSETGKKSFLSAWDCGRVCACVSVCVCLSAHKQVIAHQLNRGAHLAGVHASFVILPFPLVTLSSCQFVTCNHVNMFISMQIDAKRENCSPEKSVVCPLTFSGDYYCMKSYRNQ